MALSFTDSAIHKLTAPTGTGMYVCMHVHNVSTHLQEKCACIEYVCMYVHMVPQTSGECLEMSLSADAEILLREISGSCRHRTNICTAPASTTAWASSGGEGRGGEVRLGEVRGWEGRGGEGRGWAIIFYTNKYVCTYVQTYIRISQ